jgi:hypothetical protein
LIRPDVLAKQMSEVRTLAEFDIAHLPLAPVARSVQSVSTRMKILLVVLLVSVSALLLGGCAIDRPLVSDEDYDRMRGPAAWSPDPTAHVPNQQNTRPGGY